ncbi:hypothetical protein BGZ73_005895 [Actinomortierella ambigua]|nr:hypothetical protein BGZ73_005895 [Actinomortierella ambigua]
MKCQGTLELLCILSVVATVASQSVPPGRVGVSYAKFHNKFYVYGGRNKGSNQTFTDLYALDLSKPWSSQSPAWIPITKDGPTNSALSAAISVDGKTFMLGPTLGVPGWLYSFETKVWSEVKAQFRKSIYDTYPVTLGTDDRVLMAGGSSTAPITPYVDDYDLYTMGTNQTVTQKMPLSISNGELFMPCRIGYKGVWSDYLNKAVLYGGYTVNLVNDPRAAVTLSLYDPVKNLWSEMKTTGRDPNVTMDHCMAISKNGDIDTGCIYGGCSAVVLSTT